MRVFPILFAAALVPILLSSTAAACSGPVDYTFEGLFPRSGDTAVPLNARVFVRYSGARNDGGAVALAILRDEGDGGFVEIATTATGVSFHGSLFEKGVELAPNSPLTADASYQVRESGQLLGTFATSNETDLVAPSPAAVEITEGEVGSGGTCYPGNEEVLPVQYPGAGSSAEPVTYEFLTEDGGLIVSSREDRDAFVFCPSGVIGASPSRSLLNHFELAPGTHTLQVRTVDRAGNRSALTAVTYTASCTADAGLSNDAGAFSAADAGSGGGSPANAPSGCALGGVALSPLALLAFVAFWRSRVLKPSSR